MTPPSAGPTSRHRPSLHVDLRSDRRRPALRFTAESNPAPFTAVEPQISLYEENPSATALHGDQRQAAIASSKMHFEIPDAAPTEKLNRILWHAVKGWDVPYPGACHAVFAPFSLDIDDDARK